uniref:Importin N-terminal domain-containing protein n=1 Tax=Ciona savignyi TaxID=51511 RepID=H2Y847_CIOSA
QASMEEMLVGLERIMTEFFHPSTSNKRKREIEEQLNKFGNQNGAWKHCLEIFTKTNNEYVMMYCLSVLENLVNKMWLGCDANSKSEIRRNLNHILMLQHKKVPMFITNKLIKVIVDIGRSDWPMFYPDFFTGLLHLASSSGGNDTRALGLVALRIASEELASPREDVSGQRKEELRKLLLQQVPDMIAIITESLRVEWESNFMQLNQSSMATPPPSPGSGESNLFDLFVAQGDARPQIANVTIPPHSLNIMKHALECLCQLFSWIPLSSSITPDLLSVVFKYARLGVSAAIQNCARYVQRPALQDFNKKFLNYKKTLFFSGSTLSELGCNAMMCINELMSRNCVPHNFEEYLVRIFRQTFHLLQQLTHGDNPRASLDKLDDNYLEKFIEFLRLFVSLHFSRIESNPSFPLLQFLTLLFKFTFHQTSHEHYINCLDIWEVFVDYVTTKSEKSTEDKEYILSRYKSRMILFSTSILQHIQFRFNYNHLSELDNQTMDDNGHTEWEVYLIENIELVAKIGQLFPKDTVSLLWPILDETASIYVKTNWSAPSNMDTNHLTQLQRTLKDLAMCLQAFGRISEFFIGEQFHEHYESTLTLIQKFQAIAVFGNKCHLYETTNLPPALVKETIAVQVEALASLQPYTHWLSQLYSEAQHAGHSQAQLSQLLVSYMDAIIPVLGKQVPDKIVLSAAHTLLSVATTVRATFLAQSPSVQKLFQDVSNGMCNMLPMKTQSLIYRSLSNLLLLPWPNTPESEQNWFERGESHKTFIKSLLTEYLSLNNSLSAQKPSVIFSAKPAILRAVLILDGIVEAMADEVSKARQLCHASIDQCIVISLQLFSIYISHPDTIEVLMSFFHRIFSALRRQIGPEAIARTLQSFLSTFTPERLQETILHENAAGVRVVEKFIEILELVIEEPGNSFKTFTPSIIVLAVQQIYPIICQRPSSDVKGVLFHLLHRILSRRHRYFFPSPVIASMLGDGSVNSSRSGSIAHKPQFLAIMTAFGQSFLQADINVFKQVLNILEELGSKQKLYDKLHFMLAEEGVLFQFVNVLIQALINKSHNLLQVCYTIQCFTCCSVDLDFFHSKFLQEFLQHTEGVTADQKNILYRSFQPEKDLPSFTSRLMLFVNDLRYFKLSNSSLPEGTVQF